MQTNIPNNLKANMEQVRPAPDKCKTKYSIEAITFNLSNKGNVLSANFAQVNSTQTEF